MYVYKKQQKINVKLVEHNRNNKEDYQRHALDNYELHNIDYDLMLIDKYHREIIIKH
jgi:hypothetical protein